VGGSFGADEDGPTNGRSEAKAKELPPNEQTASSGKYSRPREKTESNEKPAVVSMRSSMLAEIIGRYGVKLI